MRTQTGIYEILVGVTDLDAATRYWEAFGYRPGPTGSLGAEAARQLYGHHSRVESVRLHHAEATSGLVRLQQWEHSLGNGIGAAELRATGCRWSVQRTDDLMTLWNHVEVAAARDQGLLVTDPLLNARSSGSAASARPFSEPFPASRNLQFFRDESQQVVMQRFNIDVSAYGSLAEHALFSTTEICHVAVVTRAMETTDFYEHLGFRRGSKTRVAYNPDSVATRMFGLVEGESLTEINFENPRSGSQSHEILAGRLRVFVLEASDEEIDLRGVSRPGHLGYTCYSCAVSGIGQTQHLSAAGASSVTTVQANEFGESSAGFTAPDGYVWQLVEKRLD